MAAAYIEPVIQKQVIQAAAPDKPQIACEYQVEVVGLCPGISEKCGYSVRRGRCCCQGGTMNNSLEKAQKPHKHWLFFELVRISSLVFAKNCVKYFDAVELFDL